MSEIDRPDRPNLEPTLAEDELLALMTRTADRIDEDPPASRIKETSTAARRWVGIATWLAIAILSLTVQGLRPDLWEQASTGVTVALLVLGALAMFRWSLTPDWVPRPQPVRWTRLALGVLVLLAAWSALPGAWQGETVEAAHRGRADLACAAFSWLAGLTAFSVFALLERHRAGRRFARIGALAAATWLATAIQTAHCPIVGPMHLLPSHVGAGLLGAGIAWLLALRLAGEP